MLQYCYLFNFSKRRVVENFLLHYLENLGGIKANRSEFFKSDKFRVRGSRRYTMGNEVRRSVQDIRLTGWQKSSHGSEYFVKTHPEQKRSGS